MDTFVDVDENVFEAEEAEGTIYSNLGAIAIGSGSTCFRGDSSGIWLGAEKFADAPFSVTMYGVVKMTSATVSGYVEDVGGTYSSTSATAAKVQIFPSANIGIVAYASNGTSIVFKVEVGGTNVGDVTIGNYAGGYGMLWDQSAGVLKIKGNIEAGNIDADRITSGTLSTSRIPNLSADKITTGTLDADAVTIVNLSASSITTGTLNGDNVSVTNLDATNITTGTLTVGTGGATKIYAYNSGSTDTGYFTWVGGSKIWVDGSGYMGLTAVGEKFYFYTGVSTNYCLFQRGAQAVFYTGVQCRGGGLNVGMYVAGTIDDVQNARITGKCYHYKEGSSQYIDSDSDDMRYWSTDNHEFYQGGNIKAIIDNNIWTDGSYYESCSAFSGDPFPLIESVKGEGKEGLSKLDHKKVHPMLKGTVKDSSGKEREAISLSDLVKVQNEAIAQLNKRLMIIEKGIN